jgi:hemerythrin-like domain-containing protein
MQKAQNLPEGDVIRVLLEQHARIRTLFREVNSEMGEHKQQAFDELRALLAVHETAEEMILRPATSGTAKAIADARNAEENEANHVLARLEDLDVASPEFVLMFAEFEKSVDQHAEAEETQEFPIILRERSVDERQKMGARLQRAEKLAPTHPHPSTAGSPAAQWFVGPFASLVDRAKDAVGKD